MVLDATVEENLIFTNKLVRSKIGLLFWFIAMFSIGLVSNYFFEFENKTIFIFTTVVGLILSYIFNYNRYNYIVISHDNITFFNTFSKRKLTFNFL